MQISPRRIFIWCFGITLFLGIAWVAFGLLIVPILPWVQLDRVLTPDELADPQKKEATLALLKHARGNVWLFWTGAGVCLIVVSAIGLFTASQLKA